MVDPYAGYDNNNVSHGDHSLYDKFQAALRQRRFPWSILRAEEEIQEGASYGTLSIAVETVVLLLLVEGCRRHLDSMAVHRPIFEAVLDGVYRELATLGIVELFIHLLHEYNVALNAQAEKLFVDVHFVFFYSAIFNALESSLLAFLTYRVSRDTWVRTEELETLHYVEIREEFDRIRKELYGDDTSNDQITRGTSHSDNTIGRRRTTEMTDEVQIIHRTTDNAYERRGTSFFFSMKLFCTKLLYTIKYPHLKAKHDKLLVQVRFHELRVHFLECVLK
jgi:hypothetical protein